MATGTQATDSKALTTVRLFEGVSAATGEPVGAPEAVPSGPTKGFLLSALGSGSSFNLAEPGGGFRFPKGFGWRLWHAGTTPVSISFARLWTYSLSSALWTPSGIGGGADKGMLNGGLPLEEVSTNLLRHHEWVNQMVLADGVFIQLGAFGAVQPVHVEIDLPRLARD